MRVTIVNYVITVMRGGGETRDLAWARELSALGADVSFLSIRPLDGRLRHPLNGRARIANPLQYPRGIHNIESLIRLKAKNIAGYER